MGLRRVVIVGVALLAAACAESSAIEGTARDAAVVEAVVRTVVAAEPTDPERPDAIPVTYVLGYDGTLPIEVQAAVAAALLDEVDVRFADERIEAIDEGAETQPVRDNGVLLVIGAIPPTGRTVDLVVDRYVSELDTNRIVVSLRWREPEWTVTSTSIPDPIAS